MKMAGNINIQQPRTHLIPKIYHYLAVCKKNYLINFQDSHCHELFYTNDLYVLIDIIVRQLSDLSGEDVKRKWYATMCQLVLLRYTFLTITLFFNGIPKLALCSVNCSASCKIIVVSSGHFRTFYVVFVPLEYAATMTPHSI